MKRAYIITDFDLKTDVPMIYPLKYRKFYFTRDDILNSLVFYLQLIHEDYQNITNTNISYNDFYNKFKVTIEVSCISLHYKNIITKEDYERYLEEIKTIDKSELEDYLLDCVDTCTFELDHNLNLGETFTYILDDINFNNYYKQHAFSYKALYPEKYHVEKFKIGDKVRYHGETYTISDIFKPNVSIYEAEDPLNYFYGYQLTDGDGWYIPDDKWEYCPVDEDLELIEDE